MARFLLDLGEWGFAVPFYSVHDIGRFDSLRSKRFQSSYCAKVKEGAKK